MPSWRAFSNLFRASHLKEGDISAPAPPQTPSKYLVIGLDTSVVM
jgi:hypothetical protein